MQKYFQFYLDKGSLWSLDCEFGIGRNHGWWPARLGVCMGATHLDGVRRKSADIGATEEVPRIETAEALQLIGFGRLQVRFAVLLGNAKAICL